MIVKSNYEGEGMAKYSFFAMFVKLAVIASWVFLAVIPFGGEFLDLLQASLNTQVWEVKTLLTPIGEILLYAVAAFIVEFIIAFITLKIAMSEHNLKF